MQRTPRSSPTRSTIHDVARLAQVSTATVSRVLTGAKPVSADLAQRVRDAAAHLDYRPNPAAQVLLSGRSHTVGVVVPDLANPYFAEVLKGATPAAAERGWRTLVADTDEDPEVEYRAATELGRWVDGVMLCSPRMSTPRLRELATKLPALVLVNRLVRHPSVAAVLVDYHQGMTQLCAHLASLGHRRLVYLQGPPHAWSDGQRRRALRTAAGRGLDVVQIPCGSTAPDGHRMAEEALGHKPTAIVAFNDYVALGVLSRLTELGVTVPDDVSVTGFDDIPLSALTPPGLTTVAVPKRTVGRLAWQRLATEGTGPSTTATRVPVELAVRGSTAPPRPGRS
ncbi:LacI family DNA-binding transcriptional regulator [Micromonospora sp. NPDC007230]|uniref:LacI family DNA-binding transcriptional regulator n=1 Tax=Micromonospora sp. NPDC007230 TaxID=3364237 RepID=UPI0036BA32AA